MTTKPLRTIHAQLRIDAGHVILDTDGGQVVRTAELASPLWTWAAGARIDAKLRESETGGPPHIESLRVADADTGSLPYREVGAIEPLHGRLVVEVGAAGTKLEGDVRTFFVADTGERFGVLGDPAPSKAPPGTLALGGTTAPATVRVRRLVAAMSYTARETDADVYFVP